MVCYREGGCGPYENRSCNECPASKPEYAARKEEVSTDKHKSRICELLEVDVGERFRVESDSCVLYSDAFVDDDGVVRASVGQAMDGMRICQLISGELRIIRKIRFTEEELADAKTIMRMFPWCKKIARTNSGKLCLIGHRPNKYWERELIGESLFPSICPGQCIGILEIVGGEE